MGVAIVALVVSWLAAAAALDRYGRTRVPTGRYDAIVVAGAGVRADGSPSHALRRRAELAARLWREGWAPRIVLTGGIGTYPPSEARVAADVVTSLGVPREVLILEEQSTTTEENARHTAAILGRARVLVVTDSYHAFRCARTFRRHLGEADALGAPAGGATRPRMAVREVGAVLGYALRGRL